MENIIHSIDIKERITVELGKTSRSIKILSAFCKLEALKFIDSSLSKSVKSKKLLVRMRLDDVVHGAVDMELYPYCTSMGWELYFDLDLHSKIYIFDDQRALIGSANLTTTGIGLGNKQNIESVVMIDTSKDDISNIERLFACAIPIDDVVYEKMMGTLDTVSVIKGENIIWSTEITNLFLKKVESLWTTELYFSHSPLVLDKHDIELLELQEGYKIEDVKRKFISSRPYYWLKTVIVEEVYFGQLTVLLTEALLDDPRPYRTTVKSLLANLLNWIIELEISEFVLDRPNHSMRIRVRS